MILICGSQTLGVAVWIVEHFLIRSLHTNIPNKLYQLHERHQDRFDCSHRLSLCSSTYSKHYTAQQDELYLPTTALMHCTLHRDIVSRQQYER
jgi:hypothetical protein